MNDLKRMKSLWESIEGKRAASGFYGASFPMNPPASEAMIEQRLRRVLDQTLPNQLIDSLRVFNGMDRRKGGWLNSFIPLSVEGIIEIWLDDRQREAEAIDELDDVVKCRNHIPVMTDAVAHREIYMDAQDGAMLHYVVDGIYFDKFRFKTYLDLLICIEREWFHCSYTEWPTQ